LNLITIGQLLYIKTFNLAQFHLKLLADLKTYILTIPKTL